MICLNVLSHVESYGIALREFARVLTDDGIALLNFNNQSSPYFLPALVVNQRRRAFRAPVFSRWVSWSLFGEALKAAGLTIRESRGQLPLPTATPPFLVPLLSILDAGLRRHARIAPAPFLVTAKAPHGAS